MKALGEWLVDERGDFIVGNNCFHPTEFAHYECAKNTKRHHQCIYVNKPPGADNSKIKVVPCGVCGGVIHTQFYVAIPGEEEHF